MAEGRMLKKKVARDKRVAQLSAHSALLFVLSIPHLDREGRMDGLPAAVRGTVVPYIAHNWPAEWTDELVERYMAEWAATTDENGLPRPLVVRYNAEGVWVCWFPGLSKNQKIRFDREAESVLPPPPPDLLRSNVGELRVKAEAEVEVQELHQTSDVVFARERAALPETDPGIEPPAVGDVPSSPFDFEALQARVLSREQAMETHGKIGRLLAVLTDADENTPSVLHAYFDSLPDSAVDRAVSELRAMADRVRRPSAYAVGIAKRLARESM